MGFQGFGIGFRFPVRFYVQGEKVLGGEKGGYSSSILEVIL